MICLSTLIIYLLMCSRYNIIDICSWWQWNIHNSSIFVSNSVSYCVMSYDHVVITWQHFLKTVKGCSSCLCWKLGPTLTSVLCLSSCSRCCSHWPELWHLDWCALWVWLCLTFVVPEAKAGVPLQPYGGHLKSCWYLLWSSPCLTW